MLARLIAAATDILGEQTIDADFSMAQIALRAGMSKRTVYTVVQSKEELVGHVIRNDVVAATTWLHAPVHTRAQAIDVLTRFLRAWSMRAVQPLTLGLFTMAIRERARFPDIGVAYYQAGKLNGVAQLGAWLGRMHKAGHLVVREPTLVADVLLSALAAEPQRALALGMNAAPGDAQLRRRIAKVIALVLPASSP
jgi:TetR/AcrR family transcriptional repressor of mexJK operon